MLAAVIGWIGLFGGIPALGHFFLSVGSPRVERARAISSTYSVLSLVVPPATE